MAAVSPDKDGLIVARRVATWRLGDATWADILIDAYLNPDAAQADLEAEMKDELEAEEATQ